MRLVAKTDVGKLREENQDDYRASIVADGCAWAVVCDGMGGANGGAAASSLAVTLVEERCRTLALAESTPQQLLEAAAEIAAAANSRVYAQACQQPALRGMGTTMVLALVANGLCTLASVGDSRVYLYREGALRQLTKDHSMVQEMVERGMISQQEADVHPQKNVITRAVGIQPQVAADCMQIALHKEEAEMFINFLCRSDIAIKNMWEIGYSTPSEDALQYLDPEQTSAEELASLLDWDLEDAQEILDENLLDNEVMFPEESVYGDCEVFLDLGSANALYDALWTELKASIVG